MSVQFSKGIPEKGYSKPEIWDQIPGTPRLDQEPGTQNYLAESSIQYD